MRKHFTYKNLVSQINLNRKGELRWERKREKYREREKNKNYWPGKPPALTHETRSHKHSYLAPCNEPWSGLPLCSLMKTRVWITANVTHKGIRMGSECSVLLSRNCWWWRIFLCKYLLFCYRPCSLTRVPKPSKESFFRNNGGGLLAVTSVLFLWIFINKSVQKSVKKKKN